VTKRKRNGIEGLHITRMQENISFRGEIFMAQLNEQDESMLTVIEWPPKSGEEFYACVSSALLFDKQTGRCLQSSRVYLKLDTVEPAKMSVRQFHSWMKGRHAGHRYGYS